MFDNNGKPLYVVYAHVLKATNEFYIGKTTIGMNARWRQHIHETFSRSSHDTTFHEIIRLYGYSDDVWQHVLLYVSFKRDDEHLYEVENEFICYHQSIIKGFNMISETHKHPYKRITTAHKLIGIKNKAEYKNFKFSAVTKETRLDSALKSFVPDMSKEERLEIALKTFVPSVRKETRKERFKRMGIIT